jgi:hypothetical protein
MIDPQVIDKDIVVFGLAYKNYVLPVVIDKRDFDIIQAFKKNWKINSNGFVYCTHKYPNDVFRDIYLHEVVMGLKNKDDGVVNKKNGILHINRIGLDNRRLNLMYDCKGKELNKNLKKKARSTILPKNCGIDVNEIPTYIWYAKGSDERGDRFVVSIGDVHWVTTSSKKISLKEKLEQAKTYLKNLLYDRSDLLDEYSMNGDYTSGGIDMLESYYDIIFVAGYDNIKRPTVVNKTLDILT